MSIANSNIFLYHTNTRRSPVNIGLNAHRDKITRRASKTFFRRRADFRRRITHAKRPAKVAAKVAQSRARIDAPRTPPTRHENTRKPPRRFCKLSRINHPCPSPAPALPLLVLDLLNISSRDKRDKTKAAKGKAQTPQLYPIKSVLSIPSGQKDNPTYTREEKKEHNPHPVTAKTLLMIALPR